MGILNELIIHISKSLGENFTKRLQLIKSKSKEITSKEVAYLVGKALKRFWNTQKKKLTSVQE